MKSIISNKEVALLGLLYERPMHGYDIEQAIRMRDMRYWTEISMSSVYKVLKKLEEKKMVNYELKMNQANLTQKIYSLTIKGTDALKLQVAAFFTEFDHHRWELDLAISNLGAITKVQARESIAIYLAKLEELDRGYGELEKYLISENCPEYKLALAKRPQYLYKAEIEWAKDYLKQFENA